MFCLWLFFFLLISIIFFFIFAQTPIEWFVYGFSWLFIGLCARPCNHCFMSLPFFVVLMFPAEFVGMVLEAKLNFG
ncbi:hypothetical protein NMG60_11008766 [Bertholletia excelsa]